MSVRTAGGLAVKLAQVKPYGCYNRAPLPAKWNAPDQCQYTLSKLGMTDPQCVGCKLKKDHHERTV